MIPENKANNTEKMPVYVLGIQDLDQTMLTIAGGKGANLCELSRINGIGVPGGFCITTLAFERIVGASVLMVGLIDKLSALEPEDRNEIIELSAAIRQNIEGVSIPEEIETAITQAISSFEEDAAFAIRSSATAEDLPSASFAGQQDTYLNIIGKAAILEHISKCWASLFTERAVIYRMQNGFDHRKVRLAVVVQQMVFPQVSGIMFTAHPVTGNRKILSVDAGFGLGEAMVSGLVNADNYKVRNGEIIDKMIPAKKTAVHALKEGGTAEMQIDARQQTVQALTNQQILQLEHIGRTIEQHFSSPQDIEWCLADDEFYIVQSRPITTLYPIPEINDHENHVYISVGHQQMMTDAMKPFGLSIWQLMAGRPMYKSGGRLFVDVATELASVAGRERLLNAMGQHDPLIKDALLTIINRDDFIKLLPDNQSGTIKTNPSIQHQTIQTQTDPAIITRLIEDSEVSIAKLKKEIRAKTGTDLFDFILNDLEQRKHNLLAPQKMAAIMAVVSASSWINKNIEEWLGEKSVADILTQSVANNVTSQMGLALLHVADVIRPYPEVIAFLEQVKDDDFLYELLKLKGGTETWEALINYLNQYGTRCAGEIDITKTRWSEKPAMLIPIILANVKNFEPGAGGKRFEQGLRQAMQKKQDLLDKLKQLTDGEQKAAEAERMINQLRDFAGYREYPKYEIVNRLWVYKQALLREAENLVKVNVINEPEDLHYLTFLEFRQVVATAKADYQLINKRKEEHKLNEKLNPPRVITSDGEVITGRYKHEHLPEGAISGLAVSAGVIEGRARVIINMEDARLEEGDILVTVFTDPSWTPLFVSIKGLVTEVGGLMTHGAVIAREYGLPAVVGVENATKLIKDGQRIRVNGTEGYIQIL